MYQPQAWLGILPNYAAGRRVSEKLHWRPRADAGSFLGQRARRRFHGRKSLSAFEPNAHEGTEAGWSLADFGQLSSSTH